MKPFLAGLAALCFAATAMAGHSSYSIGLGFSNGYNSIAVGYANRGGGHGYGGYRHGGYYRGGGYGCGSGTFFSLGLSTIWPRPVYYAPPPVVYAPPPVVYAPPPVVYQPAPVVVAPAPVVYAPPPVYVPAPVVVAPAPCYPQYYYGNSISFGFTYRR